jgi:Fungalysin/Thermolysin Propeptide Motif
MKPWMICVLTALTLPAFGELDDRVLSVSHGVPTMMVGDLGYVDPLPADPVSAGDERALVLATEIFLRDLVTKSFGGDGTEDLLVTSLRIDYSRKIHVRFDQHLHGLRVMGAQLVVHADAASGQIYAVNGSFVPAAAAPPPSRAVEVSVLEEELAGIGVVPAERPELLYFQDADTGDTHLAWRVHVRGIEDGKAFDDDVYIDAQDFRLLLRLWRPPSA